MGKFIRIGLPILGTFWCVGAARADPIRIVFQGTARQAGVIRYETEPIGGITSLDIPITSGQSASSAGDHVLNTMINNNPTAKQFYEANKTIDPVSGEVTVTITPKAGTGVPNFTKIQRAPSNSTDRKDPGLNTMGGVKRASPGRSELEFVPGFELPDPAVAWHIQVLDQQVQIAAASDLLNVSPSTTAQDLVSYFAQDLTAKGFPVVAAGDTLSMQTNDNLMLFALVDGVSPWQALTTNVAIPEPSGLCAMITGALLWVGARRARVA